MRPVLIELGPLDVHSYGFMLAIGFLVGILIILRYAGKAGIREETILELAIYGIVGALVGARLMYVVGQWEHYRHNLLEIIMVQEGGLAFLGGLLLGMGIVFFVARARGIPFLKLMDVSAPGATIGYAIARVGCFLNGCCFGRPTELPWGVNFPLGSLAHSHFPSQHIHPTQLYALLAMLAAFGVIVRFWPQRRYDGHVFFWWLVIYGLYRFSVEFLRFCPAELYWLGLNPGQWIALAMMLAGALPLWQRRNSAPGA